MEYPFWVNDFDRVKDHKINYPAVSKIFEHPMSFWYGERNGKGSCGTVHKSINRLLKRSLPHLPIFVIYNMPGRDMGHYSKGGAQSRDNYMEFLESMCQAIGSNEIIVIYEPDAIPHSTLMEPKEAEWRLNLMRDGLSYITNTTNAKVYVDNHSYHPISELDFFVFRKIYFDT